jgi:hypothetical protein
MEQLVIWNSKAGIRMIGKFLLSSNETVPEHNIFADRSALILEWLLCKGIERKSFSLREVAKEVSVGIGSVHRVFQMLVFEGFLRTSGIRTNKKFSLHLPHKLFKKWLEHYDVVKKCKMSNYSTSFVDRKACIDALVHSGMQEHVVFALHSAAEALGCKNTNLQQLELYMVNSRVKKKLEKILRLQPKERGYDVLLIEPFYKSMLQRDVEQKPRKQLCCTSPLLTCLDLYHFPLRGREQAEFMINLERQDPYGNLKKDIFQNSIIVLLLMS